MKKQDELYRNLTEMIKATREGKLRWNLEIQTTEANDPADKPIERDNGQDWIVDECYVSYYCTYKGKEFCMITYEMIKTAKEQRMDGARVMTGNMVFLPPLGVRFFDLHTLAPYSVECSPVLLSEIHQLWVLLLDMYKVDKGSVYLNVNPGTLVIED